MTPLEAKIQAGRAEVFAGYQEFIDAAKEHAADGLSNYAGAYDVSQLEYALAHPYKFSLLEVDKIYRDALLSRLPKSGKYYVLRNAQRPSTNFKNNMLSLTGQDNFKSRSLSTPRVGNGTSDYPESLNLFNVESSGADPYSVKLRCAATGTYIVSNFNNNAKVYLGEKSKATVFIYCSRWASLTVLLLLPLKARMICGSLFPEETILWSTMGLLNRPNISIWKKSRL